MKKYEFYKKTPKLSGEEEIVAHAGQGEDKWAEEKSAGGLFSAMNDRYDEDGNLTPRYKTLIEKLHMVDLSLHKQLSSEEREKSEKHLQQINLEWRKIQEEKNRVKKEAKERIEEAWRK